jgi:predicted dehydrogenase
MNKEKLNQQSEGLTATRRQFIQTSTLAATGLALAPGIIVRARGEKAPGEKLNIAAVGVGGMGGSNVKACADENIVALCDVDQNYAADTFKEYPKAKIYLDYREMLEKQKDIDAVIVATPDHSHAVIAMAAIRAGKHVYVQKPMAYSVHEVRTLTEAVREHKVVSQMGNQGHSGDGTRQICEWIQAGVIGTVREVDCWTNRPVWPQGIEVERPKETPPVPAGLDWDRWLGPAPLRPYHPTYLPAKWRAWCDFGTGSLGDMGCHIVDAPFWALKLKYPTSVECNISAYWHGFFKKTEPKNENFPRSSVVRFQFPARDGMPAVKLNWWDGGLMPARPDGLGPDEELGDNDGGVIFRGDKGVLICGCYGLSPRVFPESLRGDLSKVPKTIDRIPGSLGGHEKDWIRACKGGKPASSYFDYSGPLSETVLMGNLAVRFPNQQLLWDGEKMQVTNNKDANALVRRKYREGWTL